MATIAICDLSFGYGGSIEIIRDATAQLDGGWTGVVGDNGGGKTTLLRLIAGELSPVRGEVRVAPTGATLVTCAQSVERPGERLLAFRDAWDKRSLRWQARLALDPAAVDRWTTLSPGERKRWQIGAALAAAPDVLLLDEPTNHVDGEARDVLVAALARFRGTGVVVSHDRALLDALTERTLRVDGGAVAVYPAAYSAARALWNAERVEAVRLADAARARVRAERRRLADERRSRAAAEARISVRSRAKNPRDSDARSTRVRKRIAAAEARLGREVGKRRRAVDRAAAAAARHRVDRARGGDLYVGYEPAPRRWLCRLELAALVAGDQVLARDVSVALARDARLRIAGPNGAGKSTLLAAMAAACSCMDRVLWLPQELDDAARARVAREVRDTPANERGRLLQIAGALGLDVGRVLASGSLSPGEARKLAIATALRRRVWALWLDEPTNHLDLPSIERLEDALADFPGALVIASHDDAFAGALTTEVYWLGRAPARHRATTRSGGR
jgi:ATPase subunit of ABC transporter with duplicated ATPase domains